MTDSTPDQTPPQQTRTTDPAAAPKVRSAFYKQPWFAAVTAGIVGFALATAIFLPGSSDDEDSDDTTAAPASSSSSSAGSSDTETQEPEATEEPAVALTDEGDSGGLSLKLDKVTREDSITYEGDTISDVTPDGDPVTVKATDGGYYLVVGTEGRNGTKEPIDLTCGYPIDIAVFDAEGAKYSPIDGLAQIKGNPGCNDQTQPGQKFSEKFIFLMPEGAEPDQLVWASISSDVESAETAGIDLSSY